MGVRPFGYNVVDGDPKVGSFENIWYIAQTMMENPKRTFELILLIMCQPKYTSFVENVLGVLRVLG